MSFSPEIAAIRFGYGLSPRLSPPESPAAMIAALNGPDDMAAAFPIASMAEQYERFQLLWELNQAKSAGDPTAQKKIMAWRREDRNAQSAMLAATFARAVEAPDALRERLTRFWADHFTVKGKGNARRQVQHFVQDAIRPNVTAPFAQMLRAAVTHPLMLLYLDQDDSVGPGSVFAVRQAKKGKPRGLNENLAREVLELHTLGVGGSYTQRDVREFAELLAGLRVDMRRGMAFRPNRGEPGAEEVLGERYGAKRPKLEDVHAALDDIATHPDTAAHIARKLAVHFVSDTPPEGLVEALRVRFIETGGDLGAVTAAMLEHPDAWGPLAKTKQPFDFLASAVRALGVEGRQVAGLNPKRVRDYLVRPMQLMGQPWENPNGPDGWAEDGAHWLTPQGLAVRINWAMSVRKVEGLALPDPRAFVKTALGSQASARLEFAAKAAEREAEGVGIILASPDFQRR
ncbi:DUF1800 family protein [Oceanicola sp. D3]|uniref:DUF1800 domain-containing protein n=1 Tax=Oceanicola sp. D3 TaxID=2587163 RepID=UPI0020C82761|nr:DUF1800 domain-containing protein [Oceanicola sp. D3]